MKVAFTTLGCRVNQYESEAMAEKFIREGYEVVPYKEIADVYVINTCTVTNMGDKKSRQMIGRGRKQNADAIIAVVGCYAQIATREVSDIQGVNVVLGTRNKGDIVYFVNKAMLERKQIIEVADVLHNKEFEDLKIEEYQDNTRAFVKIQDGCNRFCSYCLIPYARGAACSKEPLKVIEEIKRLANHGFKEIILSGIHIASYGVDLKENYSLINILEEAENIKGIERVRIGSIDPAFFTEGVIEKLVSFKKLCPQFHLSLQSGSDETLKRMNRHYSAKEYIDIVLKLRKNIEDVSITTDVIVGFPGESEDEFNVTYSFLEDIKFSKMHIFKYSPRKGTKAASFKETVDGVIKDERSSKLIALGEKQEIAFMNRFIGSSAYVLYEHSHREGFYEGYTTNYMKVMLKSSKDICGDIINTKLLEVQGDIIIGENNN